MSFFPICPLLCCAKTGDASNSPIDQPVHLQTKRSKSCQHEKELPSISNDKVVGRSQIKYKEMHPWQAMDYEQEYAVNDILTLGNEQPPKVAAGLGMGKELRASSFFEGLVIRQEEHLRSLTYLHQDMLLKIETEWRSQLSAPCESSLAKAPAGKSDGPLRNCSDKRDVRRVESEMVYPACSSSTSLENSLPSTPKNIERRVLDVNTYQDRSFDVNAFKDNRLKLKVEATKSLSEGPSTILHKFVKSERFDFLTAGFVIANACFIGIQVEHLFSSKEGQESATITSVDVGFSAIFLSEMLLRLCAHGCREYFLGKDRKWNWFDFFLINLSALDTVVKLIDRGNSSVISNMSVLRAARSFRIMRSLRIIRVFRFFRDLRIMIAAIISTLKTAVWAVLLLLIAMYVFGLAIAQIVGDYKQQQESKDEPLASNDPLMKWFGSLPETIFTLFMAITGGIDYQISLDPLRKLPMSFAIFVFFVVFSTFCVMNVLTGLFCQNALETFERDRDQVIKYQLAEKERFVTTLSEMVRSWDVGKPEQCSKEEFEKHIFDPEVQILLRTLDIGSRDVMRLFRMLDRGSGVNLEDFVHACITLRGTANAVHMESVFIDSKIANAKLDHILRTLEKVFYS